MQRHAAALLVVEQLVVVVDQLFYLLIIVYLLLNLLQRIYDSRVMSAAELLADINHRQRCDLPRDVYRYMPRVAYIGALVFLRAYLFGGDAVGACYLVYYPFNGYLGGNVVVEYVGYYLLSGRNGDSFVVEKIFRLELFYSAFKLTDI